MKVRIQFVLDVNERAWAEEYGIPPNHVRDDVKTHVHQSVLMHFGDQGLLYEDEKEGPA